MDGHAILVVHLVELVDQAHAPVREHQRAAFQNPLARHRVFVHRRGQTHRGRALAGGVHAPPRGFLHVLQKLRLGDAGVAEQKHVYVAAKLGFAFDELFLATEQRQRDAGFDVVVAVDARRDGLDDPPRDLRVAR